MPSCITEQWSSSVCPQVRLTINETTSAAEYVTYSWTLEYVAHGYAARTNGLERSWEVHIGSYTNSGTFNINGISTTTTISSGTATINRTTSTQSISFWLAFNFDITWSGSYGGTKYAEAWIDIGPKPSYIISYNANGGTGAPGNQTRWYGQTDFKLSGTRPTRTGYTFQGWATSSGGGVAYQPGASYTANASITLYAVWRANTYTVSYNANGGSGAPGAQTKTYGVNLTLSGTKPTRTNYNFLGWGVSPSSTTVAYNPGSTYTANSGITLYAIWQLAYKYPRISGLKADRCASDGTLKDDGTYAKVVFSWSTDRTVSAIKIEYKAPSDSTWTAVSVSGSGTSGSITKVIGGSFSTETNYNVRVTVSDSGGSSNGYTDVPYLNYIIDIRSNGNGIAFGKPADTGGYADFNYPVRFFKNFGMMIDGRARTPFNILAGDTDGDCFLIQGCNGTTVLGSGESANKVVNDLNISKTGETLILSSDAGIRFITNVQNTASDFHNVFIDNKGKIITNPAVTSWYAARDYASIRNNTTSTSSFCVLASMKTTNGTYDVGTMNDRLYINYVSDSNYANENNTADNRLRLEPDGSIYTKKGEVVTKPSIQSTTHVVNPGGNDWVFIKNVGGGNLTAAISNGDHDALKKQVTCIGHGDELRAQLSAGHTGAIRINVCTFTAS